MKNNINVNGKVEKGMGVIGLLNIIMSAFGITMITLFIFLWTLDEDKWSLNGICSYAVPTALVYFVIFVFI
ncbi:hypothetical protein [Lysinibacillus sp. ZYM-1]|uniref:hypothetical protein n=1 Tax=Lysinibacillus sp. ZYM-1 TaxID=1681184 RepID=UPI0006CE7EAD|nr:hypothetical protein [Lysinibacillus sp. ZYM-1]KPN96881.1 hypothetical protein AO843_00925 [Lysinibacillus sp. ZYM-1]